jgi:hypothetical protein
MSRTRFNADGSLALTQWEKSKEARRIKRDKLRRVGGLKPQPRNANGFIIKTRIINGEPHQTVIAPSGHDHVKYAAQQARIAEQNQRAVDARKSKLTRSKGKERRETKEQVPQRHQARS